MNRVILFSLLLPLAACADPHQPLSPDFGNAVRQNIAVQVVNPNPGASGDPTWYGDPAAGSVDRYRTGKTYQPKLLTGDGKKYQPSPQASDGASR